MIRLLLLPLAILLQLLGSSSAATATALSQLEVVQQETEEETTARIDHLPRFLQTFDEDGNPICFTSDRTFTSPFNEDSDEPGVESIIFYLQTREEAVEVDTIELDLRLQKYDPEALTARNDLRIQVFVSNTKYDQDAKDKLNNETLWTRVADTSLFPHPDDQRALIDVTQFTTFEIPAGTKMSVWIRLRSGRTWIEYTQRDIAPAGQLASANGHLQLFSGHAVSVQELSPNQDLFADTNLMQLDNSKTGVIMAGNIRYRAHKTCENAPYPDGTPPPEPTPPTFVETIVEVVLRVDQQLANQDYDNIGNGMDQLLDLLINSEDELLKSYVNDYELQSARGANAFGKTSSGSCPWERCFDVTTKIFVKHHVELPARRVQGQLYQYSERIANSIRSFLSSSTQVANIGVLGLTVPFQLTLQDLDGAKTESTILDDVQLDFATAYAIEFLTLHLDPVFARVYAFEVTDQIVLAGLNRNRRLNQQQRTLQTEGGNQLQLTGNLVAAQFAGETQQQFGQRIDQVFESFGSEEFALGLEYNLGLPGDMQLQNRRDYFGGISGSEHAIDAGQAVIGGGAGSGGGGGSSGGSGSDDDGGLDTIIIVIIVIAICIVLVGVCVSVFCLRSLCCSSPKVSSKEHEYGHHHHHQQHPHHLHHHHHHHGQPYDVEKDEPSRKSWISRFMKREEKGLDSLQKDHTAQTAPSSRPGSSEPSQQGDEGPGYVHDHHGHVHHDIAAAHHGHRFHAGQHPAAPPAANFDRRHRASIMHTGLASKPTYTLLQLRAMTDDQLRLELVKLAVSYNPLEVNGKDDMINILVKSGKIVLLHEESLQNDMRHRSSIAGTQLAKKPSYTLLELRAMTDDEITLEMVQAGVIYDPAAITKKEDLIRVFVTSGNMVLLKEDKLEKHHRSSLKKNKDLAQKPSFTLSQLRHMTESQLIHRLDELEVKFDHEEVKEKEDLIRLMVTSGKIVLLHDKHHKHHGKHKHHGHHGHHNQAAPPPPPPVNSNLPVYKMSDIRAKHIHDLTVLAKQLNVRYNPSEISEKEDLVRVICQSGKISLVSEDGRPLHVAATGAMPFHREQSFRGSVAGFNSQGSIPFRGSVSHNNSQGSIPFRGSASGHNNSQGSIPYPPTNYNSQGSIPYQPTNYNSQGSIPLRASASGHNSSQGSIPYY
mmetsp:Transcript_15262/g.33415  ORF Transcript_15262/g.33415 Transcript_15262/m.33415 type:complete len:1162 (-) Transcript_15262:83-3568(-)